MTCLVPVDCMLVIACSAAAEVRHFPVAGALQCSFTTCTRDLSVWPMYTLGMQSERCDRPCYISVQGCRVFAEGVGWSMK